MDREIYKVVGMMSGTSLDGLDLVYSEFESTDQGWEFRMGQAQTVAYGPEWEEKLKTLENLSALDFALADTELGQWMGEQARIFIHHHQLEPHFIASHGHTIFHQPERAFTAQIGRGSVLAVAAGCPVICDFRTTDVALGGQGAPLVPIGDRLLFGQFSCCLNLGGIANVSYEQDGLRVAYDTSPCNMVLNPIAARIGFPYDRDGRLARSGKVNQELLTELNRLSYYHQPAPKSLGKEWVLAEVFPLLDRFGDSPADLSATLVEHVAVQVARAVPKSTNGQLLVTGGGAFHQYLIERIGAHLPEMEVVVPEEKVIAFKEALLFALLGVLRWREEANCLRAVTGAERDNCGGAIYLPG